MILSFDSSVGHLSYPCDTYDRWEDNLYAISKSLEALRAVDRHGVTKRGEQYRGFLELEATAVAAVPFTHEPEDITLWLFGVAGESVADPTDTRAVLRQAQRRTHPDHGGDPEIFRLVSLAETWLREAGVL